MVRLCMNGAMWLNHPRCKQFLYCIISSEFVVDTHLPRAAIRAPDSFTSLRTWNLRVHSNAHDEASSVFESLTACRFLNTGPGWATIREYAARMIILSKSAKSKIAVPGADTYTDSRPMNNGWSLNPSLSREYPPASSYTR